MELKKETIQHLQEYIRYKIDERGFDDEPLHERLLMLTEEVGELVKACRKTNGMHVDVSKKDEHWLGGEITDVINMVFAVAIELGIDVESEFKKKEAEVDTRVYTRNKSE